MLGLIDQFGYFGVALIVLSPGRPDEPVPPPSDAGPDGARRGQDAAAELVRRGDPAGRRAMSARVPDEGP